MKYFIYTRKSTESEDRQVMSLESQFSELKEFAAKEKLEIVASLSEAQTAKEPGRKVFAEMLDRICAGEAGGILAASRPISSQFHRRRKDYISLGHRKNPRPQISHFLV